MEERNKTLGEFIIENQNAFQYSSGELSRIINSIRLAAKVVNYKVNKAGLVDIVGAAGEQNIQGEDQQKLDVYANEIFIQTLINREIVCGIASEETDQFIDLNNNGKYIVTIDPLDGSSNIDVNVSIGTIFSIYKKRTPPNEPLAEADFLQKGREQIAAGYILYGPSTMLVFSTGNGVNGFTYETTLGEYVLSHPSLEFNNASTYYSMNEGLSFDIIDKGVTSYITACKEKRMSARYIGSLVADFHRNLLKGGIFLYPRTHKYPNGKLRLLFEANALAFITEQAGGFATANEINILDIQPNSIHQTVPFYTGPKEMVSALLAHLKS